MHLSVDYIQKVIITRKNTIYASALTDNESILEIFLWNFQATFLTYHTYPLEYAKKIDFSKKLQCFAPLNVKK